MPKGGKSCGRYKAAILILAFLQLLEILTRADLILAIFIDAVIIGILGLKFIGKAFRAVTIVFFAIGLFLLIWYRQPLTVWMTSFNTMTSLITILAVMQLFTIPIAVGKYDVAIRHSLQKLCNSEGKLFVFTMLMTYLFSSFLSMGTVPIVINLMEKTIKDQVSNYKWFIGTAVSRSFVLGTLWAPGAATIFLVGQVTGVGWMKIFFPSLLLGLIGMTVSYLLERNLKHLSTGKLLLTADPSLSDREEKELRTKVWHIAGAVLLLIGMTMLFIRFQIGSSASSVILSGMIVFLLWMLLIRKAPGRKESVKNYWEHEILKAADLAPFFVAIGAFSGGFQHSPINSSLKLALQGYDWGLIAVILVPLTIVLLALIGLHPLISIAVFGQILMTLHLHLPVLTIALCLNVGGSIAYMVSPFTGIILTISKFIDARATDVAIRWNWLFCLIYFIYGITAAYFVGIFFSSV